jgi:hypothetical protein
MILVRISKFVGVGWSVEFFTFYHLIGELVTYRFSGSVSNVVLQYLPACLKKRESEVSVTPSVHS